VGGRGGDAEVERESIFLPPGFLKLLCSLFFQRTDVHHPGGGEKHFLNTLF